MRSSRGFAIAGFALAGASCALTFPDYPVGEGGGGSSSSGALAPDGSPCVTNEECQQGHCLPSNTGAGRVCCATACVDAGAASCATNGTCDAGGAGCALYPTGTPCGATTCDLGKLTSDQCQAGACAPGGVTPCPGGLACADATTCKSTCTTSADCASRRRTVRPRAARSASSRSARRAPRTRRA